MASTLLITDGVIITLGQPGRVLYDHAQLSEH